MRIPAIAVRTADFATNLHENADLWRAVDFGVCSGLPDTGHKHVRGVIQHPPAWTTPANVIHIERTLAGAQNFETCTSGPTKPKHAL